MSITESTAATPAAKHCPRCRADRDPSWFSRDYRRRDGRACWCKSCSRRAWRERSWGIAHAEADRILQAQGGGCAVCGVRLADGDGLAASYPGLRIDRAGDGTVRGFLCEACAAGVRAFGGDAERLQAAVGYLAR